MVAAGVARMPEDRQHDGVVGAMTSPRTSRSRTCAIRDVPALGFLRFGAMRRARRAAIARLRHPLPRPGRARARLLSGGNIQKLILARVLERKPRVILANQPTRGLDVGAPAEVHRRIIAARERGAAIVLISEDLDELFALADRFVVIRAGGITDAARRRERSTARTVGLMMAGQTRRRA